MTEATGTLQQVGPVVAAPRTVSPVHALDSTLPNPSASAQAQIPARISVVMPLYNKAPFVETAIRSALGNGAGVVEVVVVDDGSSDGGPQIVAAIDDPRIRLIRQPNGGVSTARNVGLDHATGDWIAFLDADDYWLPGYVDALQAMIARFPECGMVSTRYVSEDDHGVRSTVLGSWSMDPAGGPFVLEDLYRTMSDGHFCFTCSVAIRRDVIRRERLRFPVGEQMGEDLEVIFRASEATPVAVDPRELVVYRDGNHGVRLSRGGLDQLVVPFFARLDERLQAGTFPSHLRGGAEEYLRSHLHHLISYAARTKRRREGFGLVRHRLIGRHPESLMKSLVTLLLPSPLVDFLKRRRRPA